VTDYEEPFLESHHLIFLCDGGPDTPDNTAAVCPNCHRNLHHGIDRVDLRTQLTLTVARK
jgi:5-methylcytosine-specific restriction protein A